MNLPIYEPNGSQPQYFLALQLDETDSPYLGIVDAAGEDVGANILSFHEGKLLLAESIDEEVAQAVGILLDSAGRIKVAK